MSTMSAGAHSANQDGRMAEQSDTGQWAAAWLLIAVAALVGFVLLTVAVASHVVFPFDQSMLAFARTFDGTPVIWQAVSETANIPLIVVGFGLIAWLFYKKRHREALLVFLMLAAVTAGSEGVKQLVGRPRPSGNGDGIPGVVYSYPSGHVLEVLTILGIVAVRTWRSARPLLLRLALPILVVVEALLVGFARMALNAHYPTDVLAGLLGGAAALGLYLWFTRPGAWATKLSGDKHDTADDSHDRSAPAKGS
jgi:undecaprenyl-diphosphatase